MFEVPFLLQSNNQMESVVAFRTLSDIHSQ